MQKRKIHFANFLKYQLYLQAKLYSTFSSTALRISEVLLYLLSLLPILW